MFDNFKEIISVNNIDEIYLTGIVDVDNGIGEFVPNTSYLYFEFGDQIVEFEAIDNYSRLRLTMVGSIRNETEFDDVIPCIAKVGKIVFTNPLATNKIRSIHFFNLDVADNELTCDGMQIKLISGQDIFLDPGFLGINIGGLDLKQTWEDNLLDGIVPVHTYIEVNN